MANTLMYVGQPRDYATGLVRMGARWYDPTIGRFTTADPSGQEVNPYLYATGDPVNSVDLDGLCSLDGCIGTGAAYGTLIGSAVGVVVGAVTGAALYGVGALGGGIMGAIGGGGSGAVIGSWVGAGYWAYKKIFG